MPPCQAGIKSLLSSETLAPSPILCPSHTSPPEIRRKMRLTKMPLQTLLALLPSSLGQLYDTSNSITALTGTANLTNSSTIGNYYNHWIVSPNSSVYDLTRSSRMPITSPKTLPMIGKRETAIVEPSRTAFVIVDMQNFFLHPSLSPSADLGRAAVAPTLEMIEAFRANGMPVLWVNWGLVDFDLVTLPPALLHQFSDDGTMATTFGSDMGTLQAENGSEIEVGKKLMRHQWNSQPYGPLNEAMEEGVASGTDFYFNKSMFPFILARIQMEADTAPRPPIRSLGRTNPSRPVSTRARNHDALARRGQQRPVRVVDADRRLLQRLRRRVCGRLRWDHEPVVRGADGAV